MLKCIVLYYIISCCIIIFYYMIPLYHIKAHIILYYIISYLSNRTILKTTLLRLYKEEILKPKKKQNKIKKIDHN